jgi:hypothetical protein
LGGGRIFWKNDKVLKRMGNILSAAVYFFLAMAARKTADRSVRGKSADACGAGQPHPHHAPFPVWSLKGSPRRAVLPAGLANLWKCGSPHALSRLFVQAGAWGSSFEGREGQGEHG